MEGFSTAVPFADGATSEVFRATDRATGRTVALKILRSTDPELRRRFEREAEVLSRLDHPRIARLLNHGEIDGRPYLTMEFVDGVPFDRALAGKPPDVIVRAFLEIVDAMAHAHDLGLLHRDLKPENILVREGPDGEPEPVLVDFGLARDMAAPSDTASGALLGTPAFMAPEQARGDRGAIGRHTDIYGLGAVLYAALSGQPPHSADSAGDVIAAVLSGPPARPGGDVPLALEAIVNRALAHRPQRRYSSARRLAADLEGWLEGRSVRAMRGFRWRLARQAMVRRKWLTAGTAAALLALAALGAQQGWLQHRAAERSALAVQLSEDLAATREKMRLLHLAPAHDIGAEWAFVEQRIDTLRDAATAPETGSLPKLHYALGRLLLDAGRPGPALESLARAREYGCRSSACAAALAMAHLRLYRRDLERNLHSIDDAEAVPGRHLEAARNALRGVETQGPDRVAVAAALQPIEQVASLGETVLAQSPWAYEVPQAMGEASYRAGLEAVRADELPEAFGHFKRSIDHFARASGIARSFPDAYLGTCRALARMAEVASMDRAVTFPDSGEAMARCETARRVDPGRVEAFTLPAAIHERLAIDAYERGKSDQAARHIDIALALLQEAPPELRATPGFAIAEARALVTSAPAEQLVGQAGAARIRQALAAAERATELNPDSLEAWRTWIAVISRLVNRDPEAAAGHTGRAVGVAQTIARRWPADRSARNALGTMLMNLAYQRRLAGEIDEDSLLQAISILQDLVRDAPGYARARNNLGMAWWELAVTRIEQGRDPREAEQHARNQFERLLEMEPDRPSAMINLSGVNLSVADGLIQRGERPVDRLDSSMALLARVEDLGEYLPCDFALAHWLRSRIADGETDRQAHLEAAARHASAGTSADCRRVDEALEAR